jgi:transcriptional regulator with XRE-family HTH domain
MMTMTAPRQIDTADGLRLRRWRMQHGLTLEQLAKHLGVVWLTVQRWETGKRPMPGFLWLAIERLDQLLPRVTNDVPAQDLPDEPDEADSPW